MLIIKRICFIATLTLLFASQLVFSQKKSFFDEPCPFTSKLKDTKRTQFIAWTDKSVYKLGDTITLIVETNRIPENLPSYNNEFSRLKRWTDMQRLSIDSDKTHGYRLIKYITKKTGKIIIPKLNTVINNKQYHTKKIKIRVTQKI